MSLVVGGGIGALAVELLARLRDNGRARLAGPLAMRIDVLLDAHVNPLGVGAPHRGRAARPVGELTADHDYAVAVTHFGMHDVVAGIDQHLAGIKTEGALQPRHRGAIVLVDDRGDESGAARDWSGHTAPIN